MLKRFFALLMLIAVLLGAASCAGADSSSKAADIPGGNAGESAGGSGGEELPEGIEGEKKIIKNAQVDCEATDVKDAYDNIYDWTLENGGSEYQKTLNQSGDYRSVNAVLRIPPDKLDALLDFIEDATDIVNLQTATDDITEEYLDAALRLKSMRTSLEQYYRMLEEAASLDDILRIQQLIDGMTEEIESLEGRLAYWDRQVGESSVTLVISQSDDPDRPQKKVDFSAMSFGDMMSAIGNGFLSVLNVLAAGGQWIVIVVTSLSPVLAIAGLVLLILWIIRRRNRKG